MPFYTFLSHGQSATVPSVTFDTFDTVEAARAHGRELLRENGHYLKVEILVGDALIGEEQRSAFKPAA